MEIGTLYWSICSKVFSNDMFSSYVCSIVCGWLEMVVLMLLLGFPKANFCLNPFVLLQFSPFLGPDNSSLVKPLVNELYYECGLHMNIQNMAKILKYESFNIMCTG